MEIVKIGKIIRNWTEEPPYQVSYVMVDTKNQYYTMLLANEEFFTKYKMMRSEKIVTVEISDVKEELEIDNTITVTMMMGKIKMNHSEKIIDIIDNVIITNTSLYLRIDKGYFRDKALEKLGI